MSNNCYWDKNEEKWNLASQLWNDICFIAEECFWNTIGELWDLSDRLWNQVCPSIEPIIVDAGKHGKLDYTEVARELDKLDKRKKRKLLRLILYLNKNEYSQQREVRKDLSVNANDVKLLINEYERRRVQKETIVNVSDVKITWA